jgi:hypothetical protein
MLTVIYGIMIIILREIFATWCRSGSIIPWEG